MNMLFVRYDNNVLYTLVFFNYRNTLQHNVDYFIIFLHCFTADSGGMNETNAFLHSIPQSPVILYFIREI